MLISVYFAKIYLYFINIAIVLVCSMPIFVSLTHRAYEFVSSDQWIDDIRSKVHLLRRKRL